MTRRMRSLIGTARHGTTLIELIIFITVLALVATAILPLLFATTEDRMLQQTVSLVEQNGSQILQTIGTQIHNSERVLDPGLMATGSVLALQSASGAINPIVIGVSSGSLILVRNTIAQTLSSTQVAVEDFVVRNTSLSATRQSVIVSFRVSRAIRLQLPHSYSRVFQAAYTLYPTDKTKGDACHCAMPGCAADYYVWNVCDAGACLESRTQMECH
jgi:type II secretory pathway pseudopilin PulG